MHNVVCNLDNKIAVFLMSVILLPNFLSIISSHPIYIRTLDLDCSYLVGRFSWFLLFDMFTTFPNTFHGLPAFYDRSFK